MLVAQWEDLYHPQADGQTEQVNQELEQFLCLFINQRQDDWDNLLPFVEFQYNNCKGNWKLDLVKSSRRS